MAELSKMEQSTQFKVFVCCAYLALNTSLNMMNRWSLGQYGFKFPVILTASHMAFGSIMLIPLMACHEKYRGTNLKTIQKEWRALLFIGVVNGAQIALNNASLVKIELSLNQVIRAAIPVCVACFAFFLERRVPTDIGGAYLLLVTLSVMCVMITGKEHGEALGITMCCTSVVLQSMQMSLSGRVMSGKLDSIQLTCYTGPIAFLLLCLVEGILQNELHGFVKYSRRHPWPAVYILLIGSCLALAYNVILMQSVRSLSSVGTAVLGNFRTVLLVVMSGAVLGELSNWSAARWVGCVNTFVGAAAYGLHPMICETPVSREKRLTRVQLLSEERPYASPDEKQALEERSEGEVTIERNESYNWP